MHQAARSGQQVRVTCSWSAQFHFNSRKRQSHCCQLRDWLLITKSVRQCGQLRCFTASNKLSSPDEVKVFAPQPPCIHYHQQFNRMFIWISNYCSWLNSPDAFIVASTKDRLFHFPFFLFVHHPKIVPFFWRMQLVLCTDHYHTHAYTHAAPYCNFFRSCT